MTNFKNKYFFKTENTIRMCHAMVAANVLQLCAVVVFNVLPSTPVLKLNKDILFYVIPKATIAYKLC